MGEVSNFVPVSAKPDAQVIGLLESALERAYSGELRSVAVVGLTSDQAVYSTYSVEDIPLLIGLIEMLKIQLTRSPYGTIR